MASAFKPREVRVFVIVSSVGLPRFMRVLKLFNGKRGLVQGCIQSIDKSRVDFFAQEDQEVILPHGIMQWQVFAALGMLIEKCTELGARSVTPLLTERSSIICDNRVDRLERDSFAAGEQCQRLHQMVLNHPIKFNAFLGHVSCNIPLSNSKILRLQNSRRYTSSQCNLKPSADVLRFHIVEMIVNTDNGSYFTRKLVGLMLEAGGDGLNGDWALSVCCPSCVL
ncbi:hypothetical protein HID58_018365 [Brassica napus]|uniref:16S rRNA (uracil(1498)-N(3))-methyltransferase n=1 Tax=Brassica napus TaxID=3708 RepID=A0ABQ8D9S4_BRANA|nr:hypothetical protein HID58_018365 [Brassica napus]